MIVDNIMILAIDAAVNRVNEPIALTAARMLKKGGRENPFAAGREHHPHRVIHAARHDRLEAATLGPAPEDMSSPGRESVRFSPLVGLFVSHPPSPVHPSHC